jgi:hypothetical protein
MWVSGFLGFFRYPWIFGAEKFKIVDLITVEVVGQRKNMKTLDNTFF